MTAINDLVRMACLINAKGANDLEPAAWQLAEAGEAFNSLYVSVYELLDAFLSLELFRVEFRMPAAPPSGEPPAEEKPPAGVTKEAREVTVGPINVYAITKEIQDALDRLGKETLDVTAAYAKYVPQEKLPVIASAPRAPFVEAPELAPPDRQKLGMQPIESKKVEVHPVKADHITREAPRIEKAPQPPPVRPERVEALKEIPSHDKVPTKKVSVEKPQREEAVERDIRRSVTVINELREVYDILLTNAPAITGLEKEAGGFSMPEAAFGSALRVPSQMEEIPAPPLTGGYAPLAHIPSSPLIPPQPAKALTHKLEVTSEKGRMASPEAQPKVSKGEDEEQPIKLRTIHKNIEVPLIKPILKAPPTAEESAANARVLSEAIAKSVAPITPPEPPAAPAPVKKPVMEYSMPPAKAISPPATAPLAAAKPMISPVQAARALSAVYSTVYHTVNAMEGYANVAASVSRAAGEAVESGGGAYREGPIAGLLYAVSSPIIAPTTSPINLPLNMGQIQAFSPPAGGHTEATEPAINLVMGIVASRAMQSAGGSAINQFIGIMPSLGAGGLQSAIPVERMGNGQINIHVPPVSAERVQEAGASNKVSNFHNTFNITVSVKGGGDEGDLRELGKKIGRILSDEIKRYGGI